MRYTLMIFLGISFCGMQGAQKIYNWSKLEVPREFKGVARVAAIFGSPSAKEWREKFKKAMSYFSDNTFISDKDAAGMEKVVATITQCIKHRVLVGYDIKDGQQWPMPLDRLLAWQRRYQDFSCNAYRDRRQRYNSQTNPCIRVMDVMLSTYPWCANFHTIIELWQNQNLCDDCKQQNQLIFSKLLNAGRVNVNEKMSFKGSPDTLLKTAIWYNQPECAQLLLEAKARVDGIYNFAGGKSLISIAACQGNDVLVSALLQAGATYPQEDLAALKQRERDANKQASGARNAINLLEKCTSCTVM